MLKCRLGLVCLDTVYCRSALKKITCRSGYTYHSCSYLSLVLNNFLLKITSFYNTSMSYCRIVENYFNYYWLPYWHIIDPKNLESWIFLIVAINIINNYSENILLKNKILNSLPKSTITIELISYIIHGSFGM